MPGLPANSLVAEEQLAMPVMPPVAIEKKHPGPALVTGRKDSTLSIANNHTTILFNTKTGWLSSWQVNGFELLAGPLVPDFWRPVTDNDIGNSLQVRSAVWKDPAASATVDTFFLTRSQDSTVLVHIEHNLPTVNAKYMTDYKVYPDGVIAVQVAMKAGSGSQPELPRFGMRALVKSVVDQVTWLGRGPFDNYPDRKAAAFIDIYSLKADSFFHPYPRAQESGYRTDVSWVRLQDNAGRGFTAFAENTFCIGVLHFDRNKMEFDRTKNVHGGSMGKDDFIWLNLDFLQMGLGGDNSWGAKTHSEYTLPYQDYQYGFTLEPYK
jgi:beta-galactosidase